MDFNVDWFVIMRRGKHPHRACASVASGAASILFFGVTTKMKMKWSINFYLMTECHETNEKTTTCYAIVRKQTYLCGARW